MLADEIASRLDLWRRNGALEDREVDWFLAAFVAQQERIAALEKSVAALHGARAELEIVHAKLIAWEQWAARSQ